MKRKRLLLLLVPAVVGVIGCWLWLTWKTGPKYAGKSLSYWYNQYCQDNGFSDPLRNDAAAEAIAKMGTNAVRYLVQEALSTNQASAAQAAFYGALGHFPKSWNMPQYVSPDDKRLHAAELVRNLKPPTALLLPLVQNALRETNAFPRRQALYMLGGVSDRADVVTPYLIDGLKDKELWVRSLSAGSVAKIGLPAKAAIPELRAAVQVSDPNFQLPLNAAEALGRMGTNAGSALPLVLGLFQSETNWYRGLTLAMALGGIERDQTNAVEFFMAALQNRPSADSNGMVMLGGYQVRAGPNYEHYAMGQLAQDGSNFPALIPILREKLESDEQVEWGWSVSALEEMGVPVAELLPKLKEKLASKSKTARMRAATLVLQYAPGDADAVGVMIDIANRDRMYVEYVEDILNHLGPAALPVLRGALTNASPELRRKAAEAIKRIEAEGAEGEKKRK